MSHALVVGGTGMLRSVSLHLAGQYKKVSVIAMSERLDELARESDRINPIRSDYRNLQDLREKLRSASEQFRVIDLAVVWIHSDAQEAWYVVGESVGSPEKPGRYIHVLGSGNADPAASRAQEARRKKFGDMYNIGTYQEVILGWQVEGKKRRWLTNEEIANGVLYAIQSGKSRHVVGTVTPWSERPSR